MNRKSLWSMAALMLVIVMLPCEANAPTSAQSSQANQTAYVSASHAKDFVFSFGEEHQLGNKDTWDIYSAPYLNAIRGANGKACVHTSERVDSAGWNGAWLLVRYEKSNGGYRVGWIPNTAVKSGRIEATRSVDFAYWPVTLKQDCELTDDPLLASETLAYAQAGEVLTYLGYYQFSNGQELAYVEGEMDGRPICGFIPFGAIDW